MDIQKFAGLTVGLIVGVLLFASILVPFISNSTSVEATYTNKGMPYAAVDDGAHTIAVTDDTITVDGVDVDISMFPGEFTQYTLVYGSSSFIRIDYSTERVRTVTTTDRDYYLNGGETVTIAINGTSAAVSSSNVSAPTTNLTNLTYYISPVGDYVMALNPLVLSDSTIVGAGQTLFSTADAPIGGATYITWSGTTSEVTATMLISNFSGATVVIDDAEVVTTDLGGGLYRINSVLIHYTETVTDDSSTHPLTSTYTYFLAPASGTYDNPHYAGDMESTIIGVIPILVIVGLVLAAASIIVSRRE